MMPCIIIPNISIVLLFWDIINVKISVGDVPIVATFSVTAAVAGFKTVEKAMS